MVEFQKKNDCKARHKFADVMLNNKYYKPPAKEYEKDLKIELIHQEFIEHSSSFASYFKKLTYQVMHPYGDEDKSPEIDNEMNETEINSQPQPKVKKIKLAKKLQMVDFHKKLAETLCVAKVISAGTDTLPQQHPPTVLSQLQPPVLQQEKKSIFKSKPKSATQPKVKVNDKLKTISNELIDLIHNSNEVINGNKRQRVDSEDTDVIIVDRKDCVDIKYKYSNFLVDSKAVRIERMDTSCEWLSNFHINGALDSIGKTLAIVCCSPDIISGKIKFQRVSGLSNTRIFDGHYFNEEDLRMTPSVFVVHAYDHWVTLTNINPNSPPDLPGTWLMYDSLNQPDKYLPILHKSFRTLSPDTNKFTIETVEVISQYGYSDCGLFALAYVMAIAFMKNPAKMHFSQIKMRDHFNLCMECDYWTEFDGLEFDRELKYIRHEIDLSDVSVIFS